MIRTHQRHPMWLVDLLERSHEVIDHNEDVFKRFAATLEPTAVFKHEGREMANQIFEVIRRYSDPCVSVNRVAIGGSMGRSTALHDHFSPDFDLVIFLNDTGITTEFAINCFLDAIYEGHFPGFKIENVKRSRICLTVNVIVNGRMVKYDILPALNMVPPMYHGPPQYVQAKAVYDRLEQEENMRLRKKLVYKLNCRLVEVTRAYVRGKPSWMYDVVRIAKCWDKIVKSSRKFPYFSGRSWLIEVIALNSCKAYKPSSRSAFLGFRRFLCWMCRLEEMTVILDPVNRYNNLADNLTDEIMEKYKMFATGTLENLRGLGYHLRRLDYDSFKRVIGI